MKSRSIKLMVVLGIAGLFLGTMLALYFDRGIVAQEYYGEMTLAPGAVSYEGNGTFHILFGNAFTGSIEISIVASADYYSSDSLFVAVFDPYVVTGVMEQNYVDFYTGAISSLTPVDEWSHNYLNAANGIRDSIELTVSGEQELFMFSHGVSNPSTTAIDIMCWIDYNQDISLVVILSLVAEVAALSLVGGIVLLKKSHVNKNIEASKVDVNPSNQHYCPACGAELKVNQRFCDKCGSKQ